MTTNRSYSNPSYASRQVISLTKNVGLTTNAGLSNVAAHTFMVPSVIIEASMDFHDAVANDLGTSTVWTLAKTTDAGTGSVVFATIGVADALTTCTFDAGTSLAITLDGTAADQAFAAGDAVLFQIEGTVGELVNNVSVNLLIQETFDNADS